MCDEEKVINNYYGGYSGRTGRGLGEAEGRWARGDGTCTSSSGGGEAGIMDGDDC